jgi:predicted nucleic acid-binding protein
MTDNRARVLVDTNIIVYSYDFSDPEKQQKALATLDRVQKSGQGAISSQVLAEFFAAVTGKIAEPLSLEDAEEQVNLYVQSWQIHDITPFIVREAVRGVREHKLSFWDAMIWATAKMNQILFILSEDFSNNSFIEGVRFLNPFIHNTEGLFTS